MMKFIIQKMKTVHSAFVATILMNTAVGFSDLTVGMLFVLGKMDFLASLAPNFATEVQTTGAFYFFSHGIIKLLLSWNLLKEKLWAYPVAIIFFTVFSVAQIIDLFVGFSWFVLILLVVNASVLVMVVLEYRRVKKVLRAVQPAENV